MSARRLARVLLFCLIAVAASSTLPARVSGGGPGGTVSVSGSVLTYTPAPNSPNSITVDVLAAPARYRITDYAISAGAGCVAVDANTADCNLDGISTLNIDVGLGEDGTAAGNVVSLKAVAPGDTANVTGGHNDYLEIGQGDLSAFGAVTFSGGVNVNDYIYVRDEFSTAATTYTLTATTLSRPGFGGLTYDPVTSFYLNAGQGNNAININSTAAGVNYSISPPLGGAGLTVTAGGGDLAALDHNALAINGYSSADTLIVNDSATSHSDGYRIDSGYNFYRSGPTAFVGILHQGFESLTLNASQGPNLVDIYNIPASGPPFVVNGNDGDDELREFNQADYFEGPVTFNGGAGNDTVTLDRWFYSDYYGPQSYTLTTSAITGDFGGITYSSTENISLTSGQLGDTIDVASMAATLTVDARQGNDTIRLGGGTIAGITSPVTLQAGDGSDTLTLYDHLHAGNDPYTYTRDTISRTGAGLVTYYAMENVNLYASGGDNAIRIGTTEENVINSIYGNGGNDSVLITAGGIGLATTGFTFLDGGTNGAPGDTLTVYDGGLAVSDNGSVITTAGRQPIQHINFEDREITPSFDTDGDGCSDVAEGGEEEAFGGDRNPLDGWDFFDVNANKNIDLNDALVILSKFGLAPGDDGYDASLDRVAGPPDRPWRTAPATGLAIGIDLQDALANVRSFGHACV